GGSFATGQQPKFTDDVRPILARHCFKCHGFDPKTRKAGLRLDDRGGALHGGKSGARGIVPGKPEEREVVGRGLCEDESEIMPPPSAKNPLSTAEKETLKRWVVAGAEYQQHWSFARPQQALLPVVGQTDWVRNPIDYFVLARLEREGLHPSPPADRHTLV